MATFTFSNGTDLNIVDFGVVSSSVEVFGTQGVVTSVTVSMDIIHSFAADLDMLLVGPTPGRNLLFMSDAGNDMDLSGTYVFSDGSPILPNTSSGPTLAPGTYGPTAYEAGETDANFGLAIGALNVPPVNGTSSFASVFGSSTPVGAWSLNVRDDAGGDTGIIDTWQLTIGTSSDDASVSGTAGMDTVIVAFTGPNSGVMQRNGVSGEFAGVTGQFLIQTGFSDDTIYVTNGGPNLLIDAGNANDVLNLSLSTSAWTVTGSAGVSGASSMLLSGVEIIYGTNFGDTMQETDAVNGLSGGDGNDTIIMDSSLDVTDAFRGDLGIADTLDYSSLGIATLFDMTAGTLNGRLAETFENATGGSGDDDVVGTSGANMLNLGGGLDRASGLGGDDTFFQGNDGSSNEFTGGGDFDTISFAPSASGWVVSGAGASSGASSLVFLDPIERIIGSSEADEVNQYAGLFHILGENGDDIILTDGTAGSLERFEGGDGTDTLDFGAFSSGLVLDLQSGTFSLHETAIGFEWASGGSGGDTILGTGITNILRGRDGTDVLYGRGGDDEMYGDGHRDALYGGAGGDRLYGGDEVGAGDNLYGGADNDILFGAGGNDNLYGDGGSDELNGGDGNDFLYVDGLDTVVDGGAGSDFVHALASTTGIVLDMGVGSIEGVYGSNSASDTINATTAAAGVTIWGLGGADFLTGGGFGDYIYFDQLDLAAGAVNAGGGYDWLLNRGTTAVSFDMAAHGAEGYYGSVLADTVTAAGSAAGVSIYGNGGGDVITGSGFTDYIYFEAGFASINGGAGYDYAIYNPVSVVIGVTLNLTASAIEYAIGRSGDDTFTAAGATG
ncbi:MAG: hypothetical protein IPL47_16550 [Phyllobacteriaceae bacterium]|nr:hypothetical protein [Phyllobacteriaceae bacterium]